MFPYGNMYGGYMNKSAFTLAEVLITLGIIGIVAAMTLPALKAKHEKIETVTRLKTAYSVINQAFKMAEAKNGDIDSWAEWDDAELIIKKYIIPEIKGAKYYGLAEDKKLALCYDKNFKLHNAQSDNASQYTWMDNVFMASPFQDKTVSFSLSNGICIGLNPSSGLAEERFNRNVFVDINGMKGPNIAGYDLFFFTIENNTLRPYGYNLSDEELIGTHSNACNPKATCGGYTCAARIMSEGWQINYR